MRDVAKKLLETEGDVRECLQQAWKSRQFKNIRFLKILRQEEPTMSFATYKERRREPSDRTESTVQHFLRQYDAALEEYLTGSPWPSSWEAPPSTDSTTADFINNLDIPRVSTTPMLLLHNLGNGIVDQGTLDKLFDKRSNLHAGSSTPQLTTKISSDTSTPLGSFDLMDAIKHRIPRSDGFTVDVGTLAEELWDDAYEFNDKMAQRRIHQVMKARFIIFERFLTVIRRKFPHKPISGFRQH
ncbi:hypothetical protein BDN72DRAFT_902483 [Pluteus cervinus]|uniref:Uncharacterized protein n=1 Tax=Pluteus cervinus TaxID=181527 RepID=A0ACD3ACL6_9AGAR|nr:hypothetical protein BDN72DRAFT_902483 [Pluteus cervinus]